MFQQIVAYRCEFSCVGCRTELVVVHFKHCSVLSEIKVCKIRTIRTKYTLYLSANMLNTIYVFFLRWLSTYIFANPNTSILLPTGGTPFLRIISLVTGLLEDFLFIDFTSETFCIRVYI
jgi:hypothetical protein